MIHVSSPKSCGIAIYPPGATFGPRQMRDWEFVWLIEGEAHYTWQDQTQHAPPDSIILCRPGVIDSFRWDVRQRTRHAYFHFDITRTPAGWPEQDAWPMLRITDEGDILCPLFRFILTWHNSGDEDLCRLSIAHLLTSFVLGQSTTRGTNSQALPDAVARAHAFIYRKLEEQPDAHIELNDLARAACVSSEHLCRLWREATNRTPMQTIRLARLDHAAMLLTRSNYAVGEIASLCGFANAFHFSRRFKEAFGQTPSQLRQSVREGAPPPPSRLMDFE